MREPIRRGSRSPIGNSPLSISSAHTFTANGTTPCCQRARKHSHVILTRRLSDATIHGGCRSPRGVVCGGSAAHYGRGTRGAVGTDRAWGGSAVAGGLGFRAQIHLDAL